MEQNRIILPILPKAWLAYKHDSPIWFIPEHCRCLQFVTKNPDDKGKPCPMYSNEDPYCFHINGKGEKIFHTLSKEGRRDKRTIENYNTYRSDLFYLAQKKGFQIQAAGMSIYFHFPVPLRWTKKRKAEMHGQMKGSKSDCSNLLKGIEDSLTGRDELIGQYTGLGKFWFHPDFVEPELRQGYIEILIEQPLHNPYGVILQNPYQTVAMEDIVSRREKAKARKLELKKEREAEARKEAKKKKHKPKPLKILPQKKLFSKKDNIK